MTYGVQITTSDGVRSGLDFRTLILVGTATVTWAASSTAGTLKYASYPSGWVSEDTDEDFILADFSLVTYTGGGTDTYSDQLAQTIFGSTYTEYDEPNSRVAVGNSADLDSTHTLSCTLYFFARSAA